MDIFPKQTQDGTKFLRAPLKISLSFALLAAVVVMVLLLPHQCKFWVWPAIHPISQIPEFPYETKITRPNTALTAHTIWILTSPDVRGSRECASKMIYHIHFSSVYLFIEFQSLNWQMMERNS